VEGCYLVSAAFACLSLCVGLFFASVSSFKGLYLYLEGWIGRLRVSGYVDRLQ